MYEDNSIAPYWAIRQAKGDLEVGLQLCTKDGRKIGNAHIIGVLTRNKGCLWTILTDAGNVVSRLTEEEIRSLFYTGCWVSSVEEVVSRFRNTSNNWPPKVGDPVMLSARCIFVEYPGKVYTVAGVDSDGDWYVTGHEEYDRVYTGIEYLEKVL